jgi:hypothetical protein
MLNINIHPAGIERISVDSTSDLEAELDHQALQLIRPLLRTINRRLRRAATATVQAATTK